MWNSRNFTIENLSVKQGTEHTHIPSFIQTHTLTNTTLPKCTRRSRIRNFRQRQYARSLYCVCKRWSRRVCTFLFCLFSFRLTNRHTHTLTHTHIAFLHTLVGTFHFSVRNACAKRYCFALLSPNIISKDRRSMYFVKVALICQEILELYQPNSPP